MGKILEIKEKIPTPPTQLPDGTYIGIWGGSEIEVSFKDRKYSLTTDVGVRGFGYKVVATIIDGKGTFVELKN